MVIRNVLLAGLLLAACYKPVHAQTKTDAFCVALTAFTEARDQGTHGMALVAHTVINRASTRKATPCQVAYAPGQYHGVLFWPRGRTPQGAAWDTAVAITARVMRGDYTFTQCQGAEYFFAPAVVRRIPGWASKLPYKCTYRGHVFYGPKR